MQISSQTTTLIDAIERHAQRPFAHRSDVELLIELAHRSSNLQTLEELSFFAKFAHKTYGIMKRIGKEAEGYDKLSKEFADSVERSKSLLQSLLEHAEGGAGEEFQSNFFAMTPAAFQNLLSFFHDLSGYKNYQIDSNNPTQPSNRQSSP
jgi:hypothetical protein